MYDMLAESHTCDYVVGSFDCLCAAVTSGGHVDVFELIECRKFVSVSRKFNRPNHTLRTRIRNAIEADLYGWLCISPLLRTPNTCIGVMIT